MWNKIKAFFKKYWTLVVGAIVAVASFIAGRRSIGSSRDFDQLRADNAELINQIERLRVEYNKLVYLNRLNEQQLNDLARQLEIASGIVRQSEDIDSGNADDIERLRQTNQRLADWIHENGAKIQPDENAYN